MGEKREEEEKKGGEFFDGFYHRCVYERVCSVNLLIYLGGICLVILISKILLFSSFIQFVCIYMSVITRINVFFFYSKINFTWETTTQKVNDQIRLILFTFLII